VNVSYRWLRAVAPTLEASPQDVAERLAGLGAPVEHMQGLAEGLGEVVVVRVEEAGRHPNADRLSLCRVDRGSGDPLQIVCGAPNVRAGMLAALAPVGSTLPGGLRLKRAKIRGEVSEGMLCSSSELGLGRDHDGIVELPEGLEVGSRLVDALGLDDWRLDVEVTSNRGDMLSHLGVAREVAPGGAADLVLPEIPDAPGVAFEWIQGEAEVKAGAEGAITHLRIEDPDLCSRYLCAVIRGVRVGPSPDWLQARLRAAGARPINNVVDATNYVLLELGQPLHAFDYEKLEGHSVVVRRARAGETLRTLDGQDRRLTPEMLAICDAERPVAVAGVMGGADSEVSEDTRDVLLECALFDPAATRQTRMGLNLSTDASYRYERGVDPAGMERALERCVRVILASAGGVLDPQMLDAHPSPWVPEQIALRISRVRKLLGVSFSSEQITELLTPLGFGVAPGEGSDLLEVDVPGYRSYDVRREIDLVEEVARRYGYDAFPADLDAYRPTTVPDHPLFALEDALRQTFVAQGCYELSTPAFAATGQIELPNPVSNTESHLRASLVPGVLTRVRHNLARGQRDPRLFEVGTVFLSAIDPADPRPVEATHVAAVLSGRGRAPHWSESDRDVDLWDVKGLLAAGLALASPGATIATDLVEDVPDWLDARAGVLSAVTADGVIVGRAGRIKSATADLPAWSGPGWGMELALPAEPGPRPKPSFVSLPVHPAMERDLALLVPDEMPAGRVEALIRDAGGPLLERVEIFDLYRGDAVDSGHRSIAFRLVFRSSERTLTDEDLSPKVGRVLSRLTEELNVRQRV